MESYEERKQSLQKILRRLKAKDPANGLYFEKHIVFDDEKRDFYYSGEPSKLAKLLANAKVF